MKIKITLFVFLLILLSASITNRGFAQSASSISDAQIMQIMAEANQRGMSQQEVIIYAKSKGLSDADISKIVQRAGTISGGNINSQNGLGGNGQFSNNVTAQKQMLQMGGNDITNGGSDSTNNLTKEESKIFGFNVFHNKGISFTPNLNMATPKDYIVGPGDELIAQIYGIAQATINLKVSPEGNVVIPNVGVSHLAGFNIEAVKSLLTQKIGTRYAGLSGINPSSFLMVTLSNIRSIKINIVGEVKTPGTYVLPSFTTSFNALYAAGGPTTKGSFRNIQIFRAGKQIAEVDLYDFLIKGKTDKNIRLEDNDVLLIPTYSKRVEIIGEVRRPLIFEIKEKESAANLVDMANGFTNNAYRKTLTIQRFNGIDKSIININESEQTKTILSDGDILLVGKNPEIYKNRIQVVGPVQQEGDYEYNEGLKIDKLIEKAGGLKPEAFTNRAILYRTEKNMNQISLNIDLNKALSGDTVNNIKLQKEDLLVISSIYDIHESYYVNIYGEVNMPGAYPYVKGMTLKQLILESKGFNDAASGKAIEIIRRNKEENSSIAKVIKVEIGKDLNISQNDINLILDPFDQIFVRASIGYREFKKVYVQGEAKYTGQFIINKPNMTIGDLIKRADGILPSADINGAILIRRTVFFKKDINENAQLNTLIELKSRFEDSTKSGYTEINKVQLKKINEEIHNLYLRKLKYEDRSVDIVNPVNTTNLQFSNQDSLIKKDRNKTTQENIEELKSSLQSRVYKNLRDVKVDEDQYQFVSINLGKIINSLDTKKFDIQIQEGDILYIPTYNETVGISGDVLYPVTVKYIEGASLKNYVNQAGGFNSTALRGRSYVVEANGAVKRTHRLLGIKFYPIVTPGSQVFIPKNNKPPSTFNIDRVLGLVSSLVTTYLLVKNLPK